MITLSIHEMRARVAAEFERSIRETKPALSGTCVVERDPAVTPDHVDEARWAAQRPARRIARGGSDL